MAKLWNNSKKLWCKLYNYKGRKWGEKPFLVTQNAVHVTDMTEQGQKFDWRLCKRDVF